MNNTVAAYSRKMASKTAKIIIITNALKLKSRRFLNSSLVRTMPFIVCILGTLNLPVAGKVKSILTPA